MTDDSKQWQEDREGTEKRMASVLCSLSLSLSLHIHAFMSSVHNCRSCVRLCTSFGGAEFWSWVLYGKNLMVDWVICYDVWQWSSVQKQHRSQHWALWNTKHERRSRERRIVDNHALIYVQKVWSKPLESSRADAKGSFETGKKNLVIDSIKCSWKIQ